jgi:predicted O-linked N-acetylglucosamine transferase (SPINDLY family)
LYRELIRKNPNNFSALHFLGVVEASVGNIEKAETLMASSLAGQPTNIRFIENYVTILFQVGNYKAALQTCQRELQIDGANASLLYVSAISLFKLGRLEESLEQFDKLILRQPNNIAAINERGCVFAEMKQYESAVASFERALMLNRQYAEAYVNKGNVYSELKRHVEALAEYDKALALKPDLAEVWLGSGNACRALRRYDEAITAYEKALAFNPNLTEAWLGYGNILYMLKSYDKALVAYDKALAIKPDFKFAGSSRLHVKQCLCDWSNFDRDVSHLLTAYTAHKTLGLPFFNLPLPISAADQLQCAKRFTANQPSFPSLWRGERYAHERVRVAYVSSDLRDHPVGRQMAEVFERHDRSRFDLTAISTAAGAESEIGSRIKTALEHFVDAGTLDDHEIADYIRRHEIDIAVDLNGFTDGGRQSMFAQRPAPVQVNYLGYAGTLGADYYDYILGDRTIIPNDQFQFYCEKVVWLPGSYMPTESRRPFSERVPARGECGLPERGFVFCCFNAPYKLAPDVFAIWMRLLKTIEGSVLWLSGPNDAAKANLRREAKQAGVSPNRLIFASRVENHADHLARHGLADLFLDTLPYNAHATAVDALWAGLPVLTCRGEAFAGRVAASLLTAAGVPELVTSSLEDYEALALRLACEPTLLAAMKSKLAQTRDTCALFDTASFTRHIEAAYSQMWERHRRGEPPAAFDVEPIA